MSLFKLRPRLLSVKAALRQRASPARFDVIDVAQTVEEERLSWYSPQEFYPVKIGETFKSMYQVVGKLGYGSYATVWLCRDIRKRKYVAIKVCKRDSFQATREIQVLKHLNSFKSSHHGSSLVRRLLDSFEIVGSEGCHQCLVHEPLGTGLSYFRSLFPSRRLPQGFLQALLVHVLQALDYLHSEAGVTHADLKEDNIILGIEDRSVITKFVKTEETEPCPRKVDGDRTIYLSRDFPVVRNQGPPILCDFGEARLAEHKRDDDIMPFQYRAPEVILGLPWDSKVDIWSVAVLIWDLFEDKNMFDTRSSNKEQSNFYHLAEMVALLGPPPIALLQRSQVANEYFDDHGNLLGNVDIPNISLEKSEENLEGSNKAMFLTFIRKMLQWCPEDRPSAKELLTDAWLTTNT